MSNEAMKLALEALEYASTGNRRPEVIGPAITALQKALANEALDKKAENARELGLDYEPAQQQFVSPGGGYVPAIPAQQEPAWWSAVENILNEYGLQAIDFVSDFKAAQQEPVAWISKHGVVYPLDAKDEVHPINELQPLYTSPPPQRTWVGLTDEEFESIEKATLNVHGIPKYFGTAIEAKLKEKNT